MSIVVEHDKRKKDILDKALDVFIEDGYEDATFRKISERCGITRTILYLYFKNKREIFAFSIKQFLGGLEASILEAVAVEGRGAAERIRAVCSLVFRACAEQRRLLQVILDYLDGARKAGSDVEERVRRRTIRMRHILAGLVIEGMRSGEFGKASVRDVNDALYALIEAGIFRTVVLGRPEIDELDKAVGRVLAGIRP
ncbi:MAG TPA: TetR/AcrR family transcriptional regulator [Spirochaetales bacterium]|nr:TetR/AcrR family transcriptional regulator [Spirochaetales bacterium]